MAHLTATFGMAGSSDMIRFGSLEFPALTLSGTWVPTIFVPFQAFRFRSLDFVTNQLGVLRLCKETTPPASPGKVAHIIVREPLDDLDVEALALRIKSVLGMSPMVNDVDTIMYSLANIFSQLSGGASLSPPCSPRAWLPFGLASPTDAYARGLWRVMTSFLHPCEFVGMVDYAFASFHDLCDDELESDGSSIGDVMALDHPLSRECTMVDTSE